jgi:hypothetical protein
MIGLQHGAFFGNRIRGMEEFARRLENVIICGTA